MQLAAIMDEQVIDEAEEKIEGAERARGSALDRLWQLARRHPAVSILTAAALGLFGGIEVAGGVLIGAGVAVALRRPLGAAGEDKRVRAKRHRARSILARAPHEVKERARAVVDAARGKATHAASDGHAGEPRT
jgi:hypothetical protein